MNFDPKTLTGNIPDDLKTEAIQQEAADFVADCLTKGDDGKQALIMSCAASIAANMHNQLSRILLGGEHRQVKLMHDALNHREKLMAMLVALYAHPMAIQKMNMEDLAKDGKSGKLDKLAEKMVGADLVNTFRIAIDLAGIVAGTLAVGIKTLNAKEGDGPGTYDVGSGATMFTTPVQKDKPQQQDTPRDTKH